MIKHYQKISHTQNLLRAFACPQKHLFEKKRMHLEIPEIHCCGQQINVRFRKAQMRHCARTLFYPALSSKARRDP